MYATGYVVVSATPRGTYVYLQRRQWGNHYRRSATRDHAEATVFTETDADTECARLRAAEVRRAERRAEADARFRFHDPRSNAWIERVRHGAPTHWVEPADHI